jgi:hypothetical protein
MRLRSRRHCPVALDRQRGCLMPKASGFEVASSLVEEAQVLLRKRTLPALRDAEQGCLVESTLPGAGRTEDLHPRKLGSAPSDLYLAAWAHLVIVPSRSRKRIPVTYTAQRTARCPAAG